MRSRTPLACGLVALLLAGCGPKPTPVQLSPEDQSKLAGPKAEMVENPQYRNWAKFPVGTAFTRKMTTDSAKSEGKTVTTFKFKITEKSDELVVVESEATTEYHGGRVEKNPPVIDRHPRQVALPDGAKKDEWGKPKGGVEEEVTLLGQKYKARKSESSGSTDAGKYVQKVWMSEEIPGGLLKSETVVAAAEETTTIEIVELVIPVK
jgi:hypothetical protein